jgi:DNA-binding transcriptional LysR family regulator
MVEEGFDLAIRITRQPSPSLIARRLSQARIILCAAPSYLARRGEPATPQALAEHDCLAYSYSDTGDAWTLQGPHGDVSIPVVPRMRANNGEVLREAAIAGMGIIAQPDFIIDAALASGQLVPILRDWTVPPIGIHAVYASRSHLAPKVRSFIDYLVECLGPA